MNYYNYADMFNLIDWNARVNDKHIFTFALRFPSQSKSGKYEIVVKEYLYYIDGNIIIKSLDLDKKDAKALSYSRKNEEGIVVNNRVWFYANSVEECYGKAIKALTEYQVKHMRQLKEKYEKELEASMNTITYLTGEAKKEGGN